MNAQDTNDDSVPQELIFPIVHSAFLDGSQNLQTTFSLLNLSNTSVQATILTYEDDGTPKRVLGLCSSLGTPPDPSDLESSFEIPAGGAWDSLTQAGNDGGLPDFSGWARVSLDRSLNMQASSEIRLRTFPEPCIVLTSSSSSPRPHGFEEAEVRFLRAAQVLAVKPANEFRGRAFNSIERQSGYSIVNPSESVTAHVTLRIFNILGEVIGAAEVEIPPLHRLTRFANELVQVRPCPDCPAVHYDGSIVISSGLPIAVGGLVLLQPDHHWVTLPLESFE